jgi:hypothetical protein
VNDRAKAIIFFQKGNIGLRKAKGGTNDAKQNA